MPRKAGTHLFLEVLEALGMKCHSLLDADAVTQLERPIPKVSQHGGSPCADFAIANVPPPRTYQAECQTGQSKIILCIRDPRAVFLSTLNFLDNRHPLPSPNWHAVQFFRMALGNAFKTRDELAAALLDPTWLPDNPYDVGLQFSRCRLLYHHPGVLKIRYEDLVNAAAQGGDAPLKIICNYLGLPMPADGAQLLRKVVGSPTSTKNKASANRWKLELSGYVLHAFMERYGRLVEEFGYPVD